GTDRSELSRDPAHDPNGVIHASVEHHHELELALILIPKVTRIISQHRVEAPLLVIRRNEQQEAGFCHVSYLIFNSPKIPTFAPRFLRAARVMPSSLAACTWLPWVSRSAWITNSRSTAGMTLSLGSRRAHWNSSRASPPTSETASPATAGPAVLGPTPGP